MPCKGSLSCVYRCMKGELIYRPSLRGGLSVIGEKRVKES